MTSLVFDAALAISRRLYPDFDMDEADAWTIWLKAGCDLCPPALAVIVFDCAVENGVARALHCLQDGLEVSERGQIGAETREALARLTDEATAIANTHGARIAFATELAVWASLGRGWSRRLARTPYLAAQIAASVGAFEPGPAKEA